MFSIKEHFEHSNILLNTGIIGAGTKYGHD